MNIKRGIKLILFSVAMVICMAPVRAAENRKEFVVVIDAGHGGNDVGAVDNGVREKDINLAVAKRLQEDLQRKMKNVKVIMTRSNDNFVTLQGRADIANKNHADLFISIHTNSVDAKNPNRKSVCGTSVYALGLHKDKENLNIAKRENSVIELEKDHAEKYSGFDPNKDESYIIFEMAQKKNLEQSLRFANFAQKQLVNHSGRKDRGVKQAGFWVLWATSMPAV
ncbi:MAG: N-acetylmuramoyl-L-alanine amidase, partial [Muribaculaceae bacterium]|nr:N-acetylmuramoyl-L-alanine amidase [Muribaculaceae bacterium]